MFYKMSLVLICCLGITMRVINHNEIILIGKESISFSTTAAPRGEKQL